MGGIKGLWWRAKEERVDNREDIQLAAAAATTECATWGEEPHVAVPFRATRCRTPLRAAATCRTPKPLPIAAATAAAAARCIPSLLTHPNFTFDGGGGGGV